MKIEHVALQVSDPVALSRWYVEHLGLTVKRAQTESPFGHFLGDDGDAVMLEFYGYPDLPVPDYFRMEPLLLKTPAPVSVPETMEPPMTTLAILSARR